MIILLIVLGCAAVVGIARLMFGAWYNPLTLYTLVWGCSLGLFEMRFFNYYPLEPETWIVILGGSAAYLLGTLTSWGAIFSVNATRPSNGDDERTEGREVPPQREKLLWACLWIANIISFAGALQQWHVVAKKFGGVLSALVWGNLLYSYRVAEGGLPGTIPYLSSLALTGAVLAGVYTAMTGKLRPVAVVPLVVMVMISIANMGRSGLLLAAVLFFGGYSSERIRMPRSRRASKISRWKRILALSIVVVLLGLTTEFVRSSRGAVENLPFETSTLQKLQGSSFITPSIYLYLTVHFGVLNQYLLYDNEHTPWGSNTLAPIYRLLSKLGFDTKVPWYPRFYKTPVGANTGTYLRELHADFGLLGILLVPYLLGLFASGAWFRYLRTRSYTLVIINSYLGVIIAMSIFYIATRGGDLMISLIPALLVGLLLDHAPAPGHSILAV